MVHQSHGSGPEGVAVLEAEANYSHRLPRIVRCLILMNIAHVCATLDLVFAPLMVATASSRETYHDEVVDDIPHLMRQACSTKMLQNLLLYQSVAATGPGIEVGV